MVIYFVRRTWENGETEWGRNYKKKGYAGAKWTRDFSKASIWNHKSGPIQFLKCIRDAHKRDKTQDNCEYKIVEFDLVERV